MSRRFAGTTVRRYDEHDEHSRRLLFAKDREIRQALGRAGRAEATVAFVAAVIRDESRRDAVWTLERISEALNGVRVADPGVGGVTPSTSADGEARITAKEAAALLAECHSPPPVPVGGAFQTGHAKLRRLAGGSDA